MPAMKRVLDPPECTLVKLELATGVRCCQEPGEALLLGDNRCPGECLLPVKFAAQKIFNLQFLVDSHCVKVVTLL